MKPHLHYIRSGKIIGGSIDGEELLLLVPGKKGRFHLKRISLKSSEEEISSYIRGIVKGNACLFLALPGHHILHRFASFPPMNHRTLKKVIDREIRRIFADLPTLHYSSYIRLGKAEEQGVLREKVLLAAMDPSRIERLIKVIEKTGLELSAITFGPYSLAQFFLSITDDLKGANLVIFFHLYGMTILFLRDTELIFTREVSHFLSFSREEQTSLLNLSKITPAVLEDIVIEVRRSLLYYKQHFKMGVKRVFVGISDEEGAALIARLEKGLGLPVLGIKGLVIPDVPLSKEENTGTPVTNEVDGKSHSYTFPWLGALSAILQPKYGKLNLLPRRIIPRKKLRRIQGILSIILAVLFLILIHWSRELITLDHWTDMKLSQNMIHYKRVQREIKELQDMGKDEKMLRDRLKLLKEAIKGRPPVSILFDALEVWLPANYHVRGLTFLNESGTVPNDSLRNEPDIPEGWDVRLELAVSAGSQLKAVSDLKRFIEKIKGSSIYRKVDYEVTEWKPDKKGRKKGMLNLYITLQFAPAAYDNIVKIPEGRIL